MSNTPKWMENIKAKTVELSDHVRNVGKIAGKSVARKLAATTTQATVAGAKKVASYAQEKAAEIGAKTKEASQLKPNDDPLTQEFAMAGTLLGRKFEGYLSTSVTFGKILAKKAKTSYDEHNHQRWREQWTPGMITAIDELVSHYTTPGTYSMLEDKKKFTTFVIRGNDSQVEIEYTKKDEAPERKSTAAINATKGLEEIAVLGMLGDILTEEIEAASQYNDFLTENKRIPVPGTQFVAQLTIAYNQNNVESTTRAIITLPDVDNNPLISISFDDYRKQKIPRTPKNGTQTTEEKL